MENMKEDPLVHCTVKKAERQEVSRFVICSRLRALEREDGNMTRSMQADGDLWI